MECAEFAGKHTPEVQFQWFIDIVSYLQFVKGEKMHNSESQRDEVHVDKVWKTKEELIIISAFKTDVPPILGGLGDGKESTTPLRKFDPLNCGMPMMG